jgi:transcriptional regulator with XRE-family HTH domain
MVYTTFMLSDKIAKNLRKLKGKMTWVELAKKSGVSFRTLEKIVFTKEIKEPSLTTASKLAKALKVSVDALLK